MELSSEKAGTEQDQKHHDQQRGRSERIDSEERLFFSSRIGRLISIIVCILDRCLDPRLAKISRYFYAHNSSSAAGRCESFNFHFRCWSLLECDPLVLFRSRDDRVDELLVEAYLVVSHSARSKYLPPFHSAMLTRPAGNRLSSR